MGEAKRRKQLDPNYGKQSPIVVITILEFARKMYELYGKGIVYIHDKGVGYVLPTHSDITQSDQALMNCVDYKDSFVVTQLIIGGLFNTAILDSNDTLLKRRLGASHDWQMKSSSFIYK